MTSSQNDFPPTTLNTLNSKTIEWYFFRVIIYLKTDDHKKPLLLTTPTLKSRTTIPPRLLGLAATCHSGNLRIARRLIQIGLSNIAVFFTSPLILLNLGLILLSVKIALSFSPCSDKNGTHSQRSKPWPYRSCQLSHYQSYFLIEIATADSKYNPRNTKMCHIQLLIKLEPYTCSRSPQT